MHCEKLKVNVFVYVAVCVYMLRTDDDNLMMMIHLPRMIPRGVRNARMVKSALIVFGCVCVCVIEN